MMCQHPALAFAHTEWDVKHKKQHETQTSCHYDALVWTLHWTAAKVNLFILGSYPSYVLYFIQIHARLFELFGKRLSYMFTKAKIYPPLSFLAEIMSLLHNWAPLHIISFHFTSHIQVAKVPNEDHAQCFRVSECLIPVWPKYSVFYCITQQRKGLIERTESMREQSWKLRLACFLSRCHGTVMSS